MDIHNFIIYGKESCPYIEIADFSSIEDFLLTKSKNFRYDVKRKQKKLREKGEIEFITYSGKQLAEAQAILPEMLKIHTKRWPKAYKAPNFHYNLIKYGLPSGLLHFNQMNLNGIAVCWQISFMYRNRFYFYMPTFNPDYQAFSPGKMLHINCIEQAIERKMEVYDLLRGSEKYKNEWTDNKQFIYNLTQHSNSLVSRIKRLIIILRKYIA